VKTRKSKRKLKKYDLHLKRISTLIVEYVSADIEQLPYLLENMNRLLVVLSYVVLPIEYFSFWVGMSDTLD
jgi:hypothetical protein